jgi:4-amino-4-deoxy-L-arabinose transferase-like glycosyltransferase
MSNANGAGATLDPPTAALRNVPGGAGGAWRHWRVGPRHGVLAAILVLSGLLEFVRLSQNGFANTFYSAAVKSMLRSWHNFFFVSSDPTGFITVDKPPLALWLQVLSAKVFGFAPLSLIVPEGICAVLAVALLYRIVAPRFGPIAGLLSAFSLAVFPSFVAVSRDNTVDPLLILLMLAACAVALSAIDSGRLRTLVWCGVLAGLAFNAKSLAAFLCVPGIAVGYLACAPGTLRRRLAQLTAAGALFVIVAISWSLAADLTPASQRPYVGGSLTNSEFQLEFGYNGFGRVGGQHGGPGATKLKLTLAQTFPLVRPGVNLPPDALERRFLATHPPAPAHHPRSARPRTVPSGRQRQFAPIPFAGTRSPVRIFGTGLGDQAGWLVPLALIGMIALGFVVRGRRDRRTAAIYVLGGWFMVELVTLDFSAGIVHPYYASALGPGVAAMVGAGSVALASLVCAGRSRRALSGYVLAVAAIAGTVVAQLVLINREDDPLWWRVPLVLLCVAAAVAMLPARRTRGGWALAMAVGALLVAPTVYSFSVWLAPVDGTFPTAGPYNPAGPGGLGISPPDARADEALVNFIETNAATEPYPLFTQASDEAAPLILLGLAASSEGGYGASDPALSNTRLATLVADRKARYLLIGGAYAQRGGNSAATAARLVCPEIPQSIWAPNTYGQTFFLVDCAGKAAQLRHPLQAARAFLRAHPSVRYKL